MTAALERRDRNRSDAHFRGLFLDLYESGRALDPRHLYVVPPAPPAPPDPSAPAADP